MTQEPRIYLSSPHIGEQERAFVKEAFDTNWVAPLGPNVNGFEAEFCELVGSKHAAALSSGTAALHLSMILENIGQGDEVIVSSLTFVASVNPAVYEGAKPIFIDSERTSWNMDPELLVEVLEAKAKQNKLPKAVILVHLYGQAADIDPIKEACDRFGVTLIEDAAEALGATYKGKAPGSFGRCGIFSFNGNKIITTSGGGMLVSDDKEFIDHSRKLATQARDPAPHYQHTEVGYNYRLSNICAGIGRGQLRVLEDRVNARRANFDYYVEHLSDLPGITFAPEAPWGRHTRWLTCVTIDPEAFGTDRETLRQQLETRNIECRPVWKPMHMQPLFSECEMYGGEVAEELFAYGLCLPSGSNMDDAQRERVVDAIRHFCPEAG
ncbi:MAG: DegT/DnrJ/EryC1/StrS family aminotransferase [Myxococcota bacterium]|jgi:pyridoxal phosphate-dependent aminotransferase EpsN|nr:DegT/DnrJ/EryC1/StrS family aminotransferase [Myxococcota bacterium]